MALPTKAARLALALPLTQQRTCHARVRRRDAGAFQDAAACLRSTPHREWSEDKSTICVPSHAQRQTLGWLRGAPSRDEVAAILL